MHVDHAARDAQFPVLGLISERGQVTILIEDKATPNCFYSDHESSCSAGKDDVTSC